MEYIKTIKALKMSVILGLPGIMTKERAKSKHKQAQKKGFSDKTIDFYIIL